MPVSSEPSSLEEGSLEASQAPSSKSADAIRRSQGTFDQAMRTSSATREPSRGIATLLRREVEDRDIGVTRPDIGARAAMDVGLGEKKVVNRIGGRGN